MKAVTNRKAWANYCRHNGYKNIGKGRAVRTEGYTVYTLELQKDGAVVGDGAIQPDDVVRTQLRDAYDEILTEVMPVTPVPVGAGLPPIKQRPELRAVHQYKDADGNLLMCVERFTRPDGDKQCLPWFYFEGEGWVCRDAPDGYLSPLFGNHHNRDRVMIHEGEKAVEAAIAACAPNSKHPWAEFLRQFGHCTWRGGAIFGAIGKADWDEIKEATEIYLMPDNDRDGYEAAFRLRRRLRNDNIYCVHWRTFGDIVPKKWDIADAPPRGIDAAMLADSFELYESATFKKIDDAGKEMVLLRPEFAKKFSFIVKTGELVENKRPVIYYDGPLFNKAFGRFSDVKDLATLMFNSNDVHKYTRPGYNPGFEIVAGEYRPPARHGRAKSDGSSYVNMYRPPVIREKASELVDPFGGRWFNTVKTLRPFIAYMNKVFPVPHERKTLVRWLCHNITAGSPEERVHWAVLMISQTEGTGKSTLGNLAKRLVGDHNVSKVEGSTLTDKFNSWMENIQLAIVEEIKEESAFRLTEGLKAKISEPTVGIRRMNTDNYDTDNFMSLLASSNHLSALSLSEKDRRWFAPKVTEDIIPRNVFQAKRYLAMPKNERDNSFFLALWDWFNAGGDAHLLWYLRRYGKTLHDRRWGQVNDRPPETEVKQQIKDRSRGEWQNLIENYLAEEQAVCLQDVCDWLKENGAKAPRVDTVADYLERMGLKRMYKDESANDPKVRAGRVYLLRKKAGGYVTGHVHGREVGEDRTEWNNRKVNFNWLSDKFQGLAISDREASSKEAPKGKGKGAEAPVTDAF